MSKVYRLFVFIIPILAIVPIVATSQICNYSTPICNLDALIQNEPVSMPDKDNYLFSDEYGFGTGNIEKLFDYFEEAGLTWWRQPNVCTQDDGTVGPFSLDNPVIYTLTANSQAPYINFEFFDCQFETIRNNNGGFNSTKGFQVALIKGCGVPELIICEDHEGEDNASLPINIPNAVVGEEYYLIIDGYSGSVCTYMITEIRGFVVDNVLPIQTVEYDGQSTENGVDICSTSSDPILTIQSANSDALVDSKWRIYNAAGAIVFSPQKSGHFLKLPSSITNSPGEYSFDVELISPCTEVQEDFFIGSFTIIEESISQTFELDLCGPGPFDTLGVQITESGQIEIPSNSGTECESFVSVNSQILHIENPLLTANSCNQLELQGSILNESHVKIQIEWFDNNNNLLDNNNTDPRLFNITSNQRIYARVSLTGFTKTCEVVLPEIDAVYDPPTFPLTCEALSTESIKLEWDNIPSASSYDLFVNGTQQSIARGQSTITINNLPRETNFDFELIANVGGGCVPKATTSCATLLCNANRNLSITNLNIDSTICVSDPQSPITLRQNIGGMTESPSITWFVNDIVQADGIFDPTNYVNGEYKIRAILNDNGCRAESGEVIFRIIGFDSNVGFEIPERVCINQQVPLSLLGTRYDETVYNLTVEGGATQTGLITQDLILSWPSVGTHNVSLVLEDADCRSTQNITRTVTVEESTGVDDIRISSNSKSASFQWDAVECAESYIIYLNGERTEVTTETSYTYVFTAIEDKVDFRVGIETGTCFCPNDSQNTTASKSLCPNITLNITQVPTICLEQGINSEPVVLEVEVIGKESEGDLVWSGIGVLPDGRFLPNLVDVGVHTITAMYTENGCPFSESINIEVSQMPEVNFEIKGSNCPNEAKLLVIEDFEDYMVFANDELLTLAESSLEPGDYVLEFAPIEGCEVFKEFTIEQVQKAEIEITGVTDIKEGFTQKYSLNTRDFEYDIESIVWAYKGELLCDSDCGLNIITEEIRLSGQLCAEVSFNTDCIVTDCIDLTVEPELKVYVPNSIIHNSINANDRFRVILNKDIAEIEEVSVFDRIGEKVYSELDIKSLTQYKGWDGFNMNNELLSPGVYVYLVKIRKQDGSVDVMTGDVTLLH